MTSKDRLTARLTRSIVRWAVRVALLGVLGSVLGAIAVLMIIPTASNGAALSVLSGSMSPGIPVGSVVLIRPVDPGTLRVGDVATYQREPGKEEFITHRVVGIDTEDGQTSFTFKGDANRGADVDPVPGGAIRGEVWFHVPYLGAIRDALNGKAGLSLLAMLVLGGYAIQQFASALNDRRRERRARGGAVATPSAPAELLCDGPMIVATFDRARFESAPCVTARQWGAIVLSETETSFTVLMAQSHDNVSSAAEYLRRFDPIAMQTVHHSATIAVDESKEELGDGLTTRQEDIPTASKEREHANV